MTPEWIVHRAFISLGEGTAFALFPPVAEKGAAIVVLASSLALFTGVLTGIMLRMVGFAAFLAAFLCLAGVVAIWMPAYAPPLLQFILAIVLMQVGYLVGTFAEAYFRRIAKDRATATHHSADHEFKAAARNRGFWLK